MLSGVTHQPIQQSPHGSRVPRHRKPPCCLALNPEVSTARAAPVGCGFSLFYLLGPPRLMAGPGWASGGGWPGLVIWAWLTCPPPVCKFVLNSAPRSEWLLPNLVAARSLTHVQGRQSSSCHGPRHPLPPLGQRLWSFGKCGLELLGLRRSSPWRCTRKHKECWSSIGSDVQNLGHFYTLVCPALPNGVGVNTFIVEHVQDLC